MQPNENYGDGRLTRRTVLQAAGVSLSIPWLTAMTSSTAVAARQKGDGASPKRMVAMSLALGMLPGKLNPKESGRGYQPSPYLKPLMDLKDKFTVASGVSHPGVNGGHNAEATILTANAAAAVGQGRNNISIDQLLARHKGQQTRFKSLVLSNHGHASPSYTDSGAMIPAEDSPARLFMRLFVQDSAQQRQLQIQRKRQGRSILDAVLGDTKRLMGQVGQPDKHRLDDYFTSIRDLEKRLAESEAWVNRPKPKISAKQPVDVPSKEDFIKRQRLMASVIKLALQTDSTRYISFHLGGSNTKVVPIKGVNEGYHTLSHHGKDQNKLNQLAILEAEIMKAWGDMLRELDSVQDGNGTLLDSTAVLLTSNLGDASAHSNRNVPALLAGGGFRHGQHLAFDQRRNYPLTNMYLSILHRHGVEVDKFVSSTGTMRGLEMA